MYDEYISKRTFNDVLHEVVQKYPHTSYNGLDEVARQIAHMDAADVAPVRHGRWEYKVRIILSIRHYIPVCSICGEENGTEDEYAYCPNCGAKMDANYE